MVRTGGWLRTPQVCIDYGYFTQGLGRTCVLRRDGMYQMFYSYRNATDYRTNPQQSYRIGYAESADGIAWIRKDNEAGIDRGESGWDSEMIEYCYVYEHRRRRYMLYNGNGFGRSSFGYAVLQQE